MTRIDTMTRCVVLGLLVSIGALGCATNKDDGSTGNGGTAGSSGNGGTDAGSNGNGGTAGSSATGGASSGSDVCDLPPSVGDPCNAGDTCEYGDDCGSVTYGCVDGKWAEVDVSGCGAGAIPCEDGPHDGDPCNFDPTCDPDGDCLDVLECDSFYWKSFAVCTETVCADADPITPGDACTGELGQICSGSGDCAAFQYQCVDGAWTIFGGGAAPPACTGG